MTPILSTQAVLDTKGSYRINACGVKVVEVAPTPSELMQLIKHDSQARILKTRLTENRLSEMSHAPIEPEVRNALDQSYCFLKLLLDDGPEGNQRFEEVSCDIVSEMFGLRCKTTPLVADGGIDGHCYTPEGNLVGGIQARRYKGTDRVNNAPVQQLIGWCDTHKVKTGYFVTTSTYSQSAKDVIEANGSIEVIALDGRDVVRALYKNRKYRRGKTVK